MNKVVCYTCITGGYDTLKQPLVQSKGIDFVCFTDNAQMQAGVWKFRPMPQDIKWLNNVKKQRIVKICPHRYLKEYDVSIWIDGSIQVTDDLNQFIAQYDLSKSPFYTRIHPKRKCIYEEAEVCIRMKKDISSNIYPQIRRYKSEGFPKDIGLVETNVILRKHNDLKCQLVCNCWADELLRGSHRDQLSFNYVCWKQHFVPGILKCEFNIIDSSKFFKWDPHHG